MIVTIVVVLEIIVVVTAIVVIVMIIDIHAAIVVFVIVIIDIIVYTFIITLLTPVWSSPSSLCIYHCVQYNSLLYKLCSTTKSAFRYFINFIRNTFH